jgi:hypothetical protein
MMGYLAGILLPLIKGKFKESTSTERIAPHDAESAGILGESSGRVQDASKS